MKIRELCDAIDAGNLERVQELIEREKVIPNDFHPTLHLRPIDFAARKGHLNIINYLIDQDAHLSTPENRSSLLYSLSLCDNVSAREEIVVWLLENERYKILQDNISLNHMHAVRGQPFSHHSEAAHGGLRAIDYAVLVNNPYITHNFSTLFNRIIPHRFFNSKPLAWILIKEKKWNILTELNEKYSIDFSSAIRTRVLWDLVLFKQWQIFNAMITKNNQVDLNFSPPLSDFENISIAILLVLFDQFALLKQLAANNSLNLNISPPLQANLAWLLAEKKEFELLSILAVNKQVDLDSHPLHDKHLLKGVTLMDLLVKNNQWTLIEQLLDEHIHKQGMPAYLIAINKKYPMQPFNDLIRLVLLKIDEIKFLTLLTQLASGEEEPHNLINPEQTISMIAQLIAQMAVKFEQFNQDSIYYLPAQSVKAQLLAKIITHEQIVILAKECFAQELIMIPNYLILNSTNALKMILFNTYIEIGQISKAQELFMQTLQRQENESLSSSASAAESCTPEASKTSLRVAMPIVASPMNIHFFPFAPSPQLEEVDKGELDDEEKTRSMPFITKRSE